MAGLTKQHFKAIAEIIRFSCLDNDYIDFTEEEVKIMQDMREYFAVKFAEYFKTQNPLFNENQFKKACLE